MAYNGQTAGQEIVALISSDHRLWIARVDEHTGTTAHVSAAFTPRPSAGSAWLAVVAFAGGFVGLRRQTADNHLELVQLDLTGAQTLAQTVVPEAFKTCDSFQLVALQSRVYLTGVIPGEPTPMPISVQPGKPGALRKEGFLVPAVGCSLHSVNNTLCALNHATGSVLCYGLTGAPDDPTLKLPQVSSSGPASIQGIPLVVQDILVVLGCATHADWVYDPYSNTWQRCGQGLDWQSGVAVYRAKENMLSGRLFALSGQGRAIENKTLDLPDTDSANHFFMLNHTDGTLSSTRDDASTKYASSSATAIPADTTAILTYPAMLPVYFDLDKQLLWYEKSAPPSGKVLVIGPNVSAMFALTKGVVGAAYALPLIQPDATMTPVSLHGLVQSANPAYFTHLRVNIQAATRHLLDWPDARFEIRDGGQRVLYSGAVAAYNDTVVIPFPDPSAVTRTLACTLEITGTHIKNSVQPVTLSIRIPQPSGKDFRSVNLNTTWNYLLQNRPRQFSAQVMLYLNVIGDWIAEANINGRRIFNTEGALQQFRVNLDEPSGIEITSVNTWQFPRDQFVPATSGAAGHSMRFKSIGCTLSGPSGRESSYESSIASLAQAFTQDWFRIRLIPNDRMAMPGNNLRYVGIRPDGTLYLGEQSNAIDSGQ